MSDEANEGNGATREPRKYVVLVPRKIVVVPVPAGSEPEQSVAWVELGDVTARSRRQAKDLAAERWPTDVKPTATEPVEIKLVPDRYWLTAKGTAEQVPAPPPKEAWVGL